MTIELGKIYRLDRDIVKPVRRLRPIRVNKDAPPATEFRYATHRWFVLGRRWSKNTRSRYMDGAIEIESVDAVPDRQTDPRLSSMLKAWRSVFGSNPQQIKSVMVALPDQPALRQAVISVASSRMHFAWWLRKNAGITVDDFRFVKVDDNVVPAWAVLAQGENPPAKPDPVNKVRLVPGKFR